MSYPPEPGPDVVVDLVFDVPADPQSGPDVAIDLTFGATTEVGEDSTIALVGRFGLRGSVGVNVDAGVFRGHSIRAALPWQSASPRLEATRLVWHDSVPLSLRHVEPIQGAQRIDASVAAPWVSTLPRAGDRVDIVWRTAQARGADAAVRWAYAAEHRDRTAVVWQHASPAGASAAAVWQEGAYTRHSLAALWQEAAAHGLRLVVPWHLRARPAHVQFVAPWQTAEALPSWGGLAFVSRPGPRPVPPTGVVVNLQFCGLYPEGGCPSHAVDLVFGVDPCGSQSIIVIPIRSTYVTENSVTLVRMPAGTEFEATSFTLDIDADSWTFGWSASLHSSARAHLVRSTPTERVEVQALVNGQAVRLAIDSIGRDRQFPTDRISVRGRGRSAELDEVALNFSNPAARTAQQLMADVLTVNGVSFGWSVDWQITDWLVPAGAWLHQGSYISALQDIAGAAGAYLQPHLTDKVIRVLPRYPEAPWNWATLLTPDIELPVEATTLENTEEVIKPAYNRVFVGGVSMGVFGPVDRDGTAGDVLAPQVTHPLITAAEVHRQCGLGVLSDTGYQEHLTLKTLLLPETGIILPGKLVRYVSEDGPRLGMVRKTNVNMSDWPVMHQTLGVETHVE